MIFCQNFAAAIFVVVGAMIFRQRLVEELKAHAPSVSIEAALFFVASILIQDMRKTLKMNINPAEDIDGPLICLVCGLIVLMSWHSMA